MRRFHSVKRVLIMFAAVLLASCAERQVPTEPRIVPAPVRPPAAPRAAPAPVSADGQIYRETGLASWYGKESQGRTTASGEVFDMNGMSAAHRTLPLGSVIRVTNLENYKSVTVRVNDRGPFVKSRIVELSYGAAKELGFVGQGMTTVKIETLERVKGGAFFTVQAAVFTEEDSARTLKEKLSKKFEQVSIVPFETSLGKLYRVRVGSYGTEEKAELIASKLNLEGLEPLVMRKD